MPMGVASMSFTWRMPSASSCRHVVRQLLAVDGGLQRRAPGFPAPAWSCRSRTRPVTTVSRPLGMSDLQGLHRMDGPGGQVDASPARTVRSAGHAVGRGTCAVPARKGPMLGGGILLPAAPRVPCAITRPPSAPGLRPHLNDPVRLRKDLRVVIHQHARSCRRPPGRASRRSGPQCWQGCRPMEGSSST